MCSSFLFVLSRSDPLFDQGVFFLSDAPIPCLSVLEAVYERSSIRFPFAFKKLSEAVQELSRATGL